LVLRGFAKAGLLTSHDYVALANFLFTSTAYYMGTIEMSDLEKHADRGRLDDWLPPAASDHLKSRRALRRYLDFQGGDSEPRFKSIEEFWQFTKDLGSLVAKIRQSLNERSGQLNSKYRTLRGQMKLPEPYVKQRHDNECFNLPQGSQVFEVIGFPFLLYLAKQDGSFRIVSIEMVSQ